MLRSMSRNAVSPVRLVTAPWPGTTSVSLSIIGSSLSTASIIPRNDPSEDSSITG